MISDESDVPALYKWAIDWQGPQKNCEERSIKINTFILEANVYLRRALDSAVVLVTLKNVARFVFGNQEVKCRVAN